MDFESIVVRECVRVYGCACVCDVMDGILGFEIVEVAGFDLEVAPAVAALVASMPSLTRQRSA